ncbi:hypothetical protein D3C81_1332810 [compost metagenome]
MDVHIIPTPQFVDNAADISIRKVKIALFPGDYLSRIYIFYGHRMCGYNALFTRLEDNALMAIGQGDGAA